MGFKYQTLGGVLKINNKIITERFHVQLKLQLPETDITDVALQELQCYIEKDQLPTTLSPCFVALCLYLNLNLSLDLRKKAETLPSSYL